MMKLFYTLLFFLTLSSLHAQTLADVIRDSDIHNTLEVALNESGLMEELEGDETYTIFAPTDDAFAAIDAAYLNELLADPDGDLRQILRYHVVNAEVPAAGLNDGDLAKSLLGQDIEIGIFSDSIYTNSATVIMTDVVASNGIIHVIDAVLLPPSSTVIDVVLNSPVHDMLEIAIEQAQLTEPLSIGGPFTLFAPTDAAFAALDMNYFQELLSDPTADLQKILRYHVINDFVRTENLFDAQLVTSNLGQNILIDVEDDVIRINNALVTIEDIETFNGVVHVIDAIMLPPASTVMDVIVNSSAHNSLETALVQAELSAGLSGEGPYTIFAPSDDAFTQIDPNVLSELFEIPTGTLQRLLSYHVVNGYFTKDGLLSLDTLDSRLGQSILTNTTENEFLANGVLISVRDIETYNGVVHVIDEVLTPPATNVLEVVANSTDHTILEDLVYDAMLDDDLSADGYMTLFAPTDDAFGMIDQEVLNALSADPMGNLQDVLLYHVLDTELLAGDLNDGDALATLANQDININIGDQVVINGESMVTLSDIQTYNGTVHVIDRVLLPQLTSVRNLEELQVSILPNPATDYLILNLPSAMQNQEVEVQLINLTGTTVHSWVVNNDATRLFLDDLSSGTYILLLQTNDAYAKAKVIVK